MIPKKIKIVNFLNHNCSEVDFEKFNVALIVGSFNDDPNQSNGSGKSSIFEAIAWALFGKSRHKKKNGVIKRDRDSCEVDFEFYLDDSLYRIKRMRNKVINDSTVVFEYWDGQKYNSLTSDTNTATDKKILDTLKVDYDVFVNSVYFKQNDISMFAESAPSKRKDILKSLLRMEKWDKYQSKAKDKSKALDIKIKEKNQHLISINEIDYNLENCAREIKELKKKIYDNNNMFDEINSKLSSEKFKFQSIYQDNNLFEKLSNLQKEKSYTDKRIKEISDVKKKNDQEINNANIEIASLDQKLNIFKDKINRAKGIDLKSLESKIIYGRSKIQFLEDRINLLSANTKLQDKCDICERPLNSAQSEKIRKRLRQDLADAKQKYKNISKQINRAENKLKDFEKVVALANKATVNKDRAELKIAQLKKLIDSCIENNKNLDEEISRLSSKDIDIEIKKIKSYLNDNKEEVIKNKIHKLEDQLNECKARGNKLNMAYGSNFNKRKELLKQKTEQIKLNEELKKLKREYFIYDKLKSYFGKDGIQSVIIENVIDELEDYANDILASICNEPMSIAIKTQKQNDNGTWSETFDISVKDANASDDFETFSGGQQFRISLALRLALSNILANRMGGKIKFLLLDEVTSNLDNKGLEMFIDVIHSLGKEMKILIITHSDRLKEKFDNVIMINRTSSGSTIV